MAEIAESGGGGHGKGKKRAKKGSTRVDMTPMVDLAFLLLTFFVLTSTFSKPKVMPLNYPAKVKDPSTVKAPKVNNAATFILADDKVYYYRGEFYPKTKPGPNGPTELQEANFGTGENSVRKMLASWNEYVIRNKAILQQKLDTIKKHKTKIKTETTTPHNTALTKKPTETHTEHRKYKKEHE